MFFASAGAAAKHTVKNCHKPALAAPVMFGSPIPHFLEDQILFSQDILESTWIEIQITRFASVSIDR